MNCIECKEYLVAHLEDTLDPDTAADFRLHLATCEECRLLLESSAALQKRLLQRGRMTADVSQVGPVMDRINRPNIVEQSIETERGSFMNKLLKWRWTLGMGAIASAAVLILVAIIATPNMQVAAEEIMAKGANAMAKLSSIHLRGQLRTLPADNFSYIAPEMDFVTIELWKEFGPVPKWRVDKPGRIAVMDGQTTMLYIKPDYAFKLPKPSASAFDTQWLHDIANINQALDDEMASIKKHGWTTTVAHEASSDGKAKSVVTIEAKSGYNNDDYLKNIFFCTADTQRVYEFDDQTGFLTSARIFLHAATGTKLIFELTQIDCNPKIASDIFKLQIPEGVTWKEEMQVLPDNEKYASMTSEQAARAFFEACGRDDWKEAGKFCTMTGSLKDYLGGVKLISLGTSFTSMLSIISGAQFVPYEIKMKDGQVKKFNIALKRDPHTKRWFVDGGL
ncbi:MAG: zf-HC2 domain-containing protein [Candidatus Riflebacteria bacterium]|nr:zf-HC2 domain-containing protein [Candidatus Riflebacteria bacterium]